MSYYTYIIYRLYSWRIKSKDQIPEFRVILTMSLLHCLQLLIIYQVLIALVPSLRSRLKINETFILLFFCVFIGIYSLLVYNKRKWQGYLNHYSEESVAKRKSGTVVLILFTMGTLILSIITPILLAVFFTKDI